MIGATKVVMARRHNEYILEPLSNSMCDVVEWNKSPSEKAPRMFDTADPTMFPIASEGLPCASDAPTTTSYNGLDRGEYVGSSIPLPILHRQLAEQSLCREFLFDWLRWRYGRRIYQHRIPGGIRC